MPSRLTATPGCLLNELIAADGDFLAAELRPEVQARDRELDVVHVLDALRTEGVRPEHAEGAGDILDRLRPLVGGDDDLFDQIVLGWLRCFLSPRRKRRMPPRPGPRPSA